MIRFKKTFVISLGGIKRRARRPWLWVVVLVAPVGVFILGELVARFGLGLGDPPLYVAHAEMEYLLKPNQEVRRFGRRIKINQYGMRSEDFPSVKRVADELRVLVYGDSIVNGGSLTDQAELATSLLRDRLALKTGRSVVVGNVSAGSWGPPNILAHYKEFGALDADMVVLVIASHDVVDVPGFSGLNPVSQPTRRPRLALFEALKRYLWPRIRLQLTGGKANASDVLLLSKSEQEAWALSDLRSFVLALIGRGLPVLVVWHPEQQELDLNGIAPRGEKLVMIAQEAGASVENLTEYYQNAMAQGVVVYRDDLHLSVEGQSVLAEAMGFWIEQQLDVVEAGRVE